MKYYIADTHFGHENIIRFCNRPFSSVNEMNEVIINNWNKRVKEIDEIYIAGDMFFKMNIGEVEAILNRLKGRKHLIIGNHDSSWITDELIDKYFESCNNYLEIHDYKKFIVLSHYPMLSYNKQSGGYMIHGHIHNDTLFDYWPVLVRRERILNAGVDINGFKPVTINELIENNKKYKQDLLDSYPRYLLSIRFNTGYVYNKGTNREELYNVLNPILEKHGIKEMCESLYNVCDLKKSKDFIEMFYSFFKDNDRLSKIVKYFILIYIDESGKINRLL